MHRFFISPKDISGNSAILSGQEAKHLIKVLRLSVGKEVQLFDGTGMLHLATISAIQKNRATLTVTRSEKAENKPPFLHVGQAVLKKKKMDLVVQKITELGVEELQPFKSQHCDLTYNPDIQKNRWQKIATEACKQCRRPIQPQINNTLDFETVLNESEPFDQKIILWEKETTNSFAPFPVSPSPNSVYLLIGPEGGFTSNEITTAVAAGFKTVSLGPRILRAETATISAIAIVQWLLNQAKQIAPL